MKLVLRKKGMRTTFENISGMRLEVEDKAVEFFFLLEKFSFTDSRRRNSFVLMGVVGVEDGRPKERLSTRHFRDIHGYSCREDVEIFFWLEKIMQLELVVAETICSLTKKTCPRVEAITTKR